MNGTHIHMADATRTVGGSRAWQNWSGSASDTAPQRAPASVDELAALVRQAAADGTRVRVAGSGHSFSPIARSDGVRVSLAALPRTFEVRGTSVTVSAGTTLRELN